MSDELDFNTVALLMHESDFGYFYTTLQLKSWSASEM